MYPRPSTVAAVAFGEDRSIAPSSHCLSGHMVGHMALAGLHSWLLARDR